MKGRTLKLSLVGLALFNPLSMVHADTMGVGVTGLYLHPNASNLTYAIETQPLPVPAPSWSQEMLKPDYNGAFDLALFYGFSNQNNQLQLNWLHFNSTDSDSASESGTTSIAPPYYFGPLAQAMRDTKAFDQVKFKVDDLNLVLSHALAPNESIRVHSFAGLGAGFLKQTLSTTYTGQNTNDVSCQNRRVSVCH